MYCRLLEQGEAASFSHSVEAVGSPWHGWALCRLLSAVAANLHAGGDQVGECAGASPPKASVPAPSASALPPRRLACLPHAREHTEGRSDALSC